MTTSATIQRSFPEPDIVLLTLDQPGKGANVLSRSVMEEFSAALDDLESRTDLAGLIIISGKPNQFVAGADLREFAASLTMPREEVEDICRGGQRLFARLSATPFVTVAAVDGNCLGGGAELATWCDRRVMADQPRTQFGFPEVKLGLMPGWGGTARAPRMVGLFNAVEMITGGESLTAPQAAAMGWAQDVVPTSQLLAAAVRMIREEQRSQAYLADRKRWAGPLDITAEEIGFLGAAVSGYIHQQTHGNYPAPFAALETMLGGAALDVTAACELEAESMARLFGSPVNAALLNVFFLTDRNKKDRGVDQEVTPERMASVTVLGAGIMGAGIAGANLKRGLRVTLGDVSEEALQRGQRQALEEAAYNRTTKGADPQRLVALAPQLLGSQADPVLAESDVIIEAVVEQFEVKAALLQRLEPLMADQAILASNTSTIPITRLAAGLQRPQRFCGIHFFNPVRQMKLVEIIRGERTSDQTVATAVAYTKSLGKMPVVVHDGPGFLVNRLLTPYLEDALNLLAEGQPIAAIDGAARKFGMPMGPFELYDMVGLDTASYAGKILCEAFSDRFPGSPIVPAMMEAGRLGRKSGRGFYDHRQPKAKRQEDPDVMEVLQPYIHGNGTKLSAEQLTHRLFLPMLLEATRLLEERRVRSPRDVDIALVFGTGFPPFRGGLLFWADQLGADKVLQLLQPWQSLGTAYRPTELLLRCAAEGKTLYELALNSGEPPA